MEGLIEQNPRPKNKQTGKKSRKRQLRFPNALAILLIIFSFTVAGRHFGGIYKEKMKIADENAKIEAMLQKERDSEEARKERVLNSKVAYLTFDDGPNGNTEKILDTLKVNDIKATFFLVGNMIENNPAITKKIYDQGHTIANHTYSHKYKYSSKEEFLDELEKTDALISSAIGADYKSYFVRVPGGSMGKTLPKEVIKENGYKSINWTGIFGDTEKGGKVNSEYVLNRVKETSMNDKYEVVLAHGTKSVTVDTLQAVIDSLKENGYIFEPLMEDSPINFD